MVQRRTGAKVDKGMSTAMATLACNKNRHNSHIGFKPKKRNEKKTCCHLFTGERIQVHSFVS
jgi:hypothetical protein